MRDAQSLLLELRRRLPVVGLRQAQQLLAQAGGDLAAAEALFRQHAVGIVVQRAGVDADMTAGHLQRGGYDIHAALTSIEAARYTLTERILRRYRNRPEEALIHLTQAVEQAAGLKLGFVPDLTELQLLTGPQFCVVLLHEWLGYESWENFSSAVYLYPDEVQNQLRQELQMPELADCVQYHRQRQEVLRQLHAASPRQKLWDILAEDEALQRYEAQFARLRPQLTPRLLEYVRQHIGSFP